MEALFDKYLEKARTELSGGYMVSAESFLKSANYINPDHVDVIYCQVELFRKKGLFQEAVSCLEKGLKLYPYHVWWVLELADILLNRLQKPCLALDWLGRLSRCCQLSSPQRLRIFRLQAEALIEQGRLYEAASLLHKAVSLFPHDLTLLFLRGSVALQRGNFYLAASSFHQLLRLDPNHRDAHYYLGLAFSALGELRLMLQHFEKVFRLDQHDNTPTRFSAQTFRKIVVDVLNSEAFSDLFFHRVECLSYPSSEHLKKIDMDPRRFGYLSISSEGHYTLVLFQQNLERDCKARSEFVHEIECFISSLFSSDCSLLSENKESQLSTL